MAFYLPPPTPDEIYHHGILGQKWGKKNGPPYPLGASDHSAAERKAGWKKSLDRHDKKVNRISSIGSGTLKNVTKQRDKTLTARQKNRQRLENKYDKKYEKLYKKGASEEHLKFVKDKKSYKLKDFDEGTRLVKAGYKKYSDTIIKYRTAKLKAFEDKVYKKDPAYKKAVKDYVNQVLSDTNYGGMAYTTLSYTTNIAAAERKELRDKRRS